MRKKYIFLPLAVLALMGGYTLHAQERASQFDSAVWQSDIRGERVEMIGPLMGYVLKVGMTSDEVDLLLGVPNKEISRVDVGGLFEPSRSIVYNISIDDEGKVYKKLVLDFSSNGQILTNFYIRGESNLFVF